MVAELRVRFLILVLAVLIDTREAWVVVICVPRGVMVDAEMGEFLSGLVPVLIADSQMRVRWIVVAAAVWAGLVELVMLGSFHVG